MVAKEVGSHPYWEGEGWRLVTPQVRVIEEQYYLKAVRGGVGMGRLTLQGNGNGGELHLKSERRGIR